MAVGVRGWKRMLIKVLIWLLFLAAIYLPFALGVVPVSAHSGYETHAHLFDVDTYSTNPGIAGSTTGAGNEHMGHRYTTTATANGGYLVQIGFYRHTTSSLGTAPTLQFNNCAATSGSAEGINLPTTGSIGWEYYTLTTPPQVSTGQCWGVMFTTSVGGQQLRYGNSTGNGGQTYGTNTASGHFGFTGTYFCSGCWIGNGGTLWTNPNKWAIDVVWSPTSSLSYEASEFHLSESERRSIEVVGKAGTASVAEAQLKLGGTNVEVDWRIRSYDSEQRIDNVRSIRTLGRNEVVYTDCVGATAYDVVPWESDDLPSGQWNVRFELVGTQYSAGCTGGTERGVVKVPKVAGIVWYDPYTATCYAQVAEDRAYFDETWSCTYVLVAGVLQSSPFPAATAIPTPPATPTPAPPAPTVTPYATVAQQYNPDVAGAINRQTDVEAGWTRWLGDTLNGAINGVTGAIGGLAGQLGQTATNLVVGDLTRMQELGNDLDTAWQQEIGPMATAQADITSVGTGLTTPSSEDCEEWSGVSFVADAFGGGTVTVIPGSWGPLFCSWKPTLNLILKWGANVAALGLAVKAWSRLAN